MSALIVTIFVLTGPYAGKTIKLGKFQFVDGELTVNATPEDTGRLALSLERNWQAYPQGHPKLLKEKTNGKRSVPQGSSEPNRDSNVQRGVQPNGEGAPAGGETADDGSGAGAAAAGSSPQLAVWDGQQSRLISDEEAVALAFREATEENPVKAHIDMGDGAFIDVVVVGFEDGAPILSDESEAALEAAIGGVPATDEGTGEASTPAPTAGEPVHEPNEKLLRALHALDPADDSHWTRDGKPAMSAVGVAYGSEDVTRADVEAVAPGYNRSAAQAAK
ncbi:hypothetical protein CPT_Sonora_009 [Stenotrophomonas phage Sonora]|nr:hypothetical protein CPT_Sonora_009 [Stenotrophomonas phage Sonora]